MSVPNASSRSYSREFKKDVRGISHNALPALTAYDWPGNMRELEKMIERSVALTALPVIQRAARAPVTSKA